MTISEAYANFETYYLVNEDKSTKTVKEYRSRLLGKSGLVTLVGDIPVSQLGLDHIVRWKLFLREEGLQPTYINHCLSAARWFLKWLGEHEFRVLDWRQIVFEQEEKHKPKTLLTPLEVQQLKQHAKNPRDKAIIDLFFGTGMRSAELISLDRFEWEGAVIINGLETSKGQEAVWEVSVLGKNKRYRAIHFYQDVKNTVDSYLEARTDRYRPLFVSQQNRRISYSMVSRMLHDVSRRAGMTKRVTQHVFRHSNATELAVNGMPIPVLAAHLGHTDGVVTQRIYTNEISSIQTRRAYARAYSALKVRPEQEQHP